MTATLQRHKQSNGLSNVNRHYYKPRGSCAKAFTCRDSELLLSGPAGTGKSRACLEKIHLAALATSGFRGLIVRKTATSLTSTALVTFKEHVAKEAIEAGVCSWYGGSAQEAAQYRYQNGSAILVGGMDKATRIMSSEYDMIYVQEAIELTENDWEALTTRLRHGAISFQQLIADTNPDTGTHWLKQRGDNKKTTIINTTHTDNPMLYKEVRGGLELTVQGRSYLEKLENLTGVRKSRLKDGLWVAAEGIIYEGWDSTVHLIDRFEIPKEWTRYYAVDFGYTNPFCLQRWAEDPDGRLYLYAEQYMTKRIVEDHCEELKKILARNPEPAPRAIICDHQAEDRATLERHIGRSTVAAHKSVSDGIQAVQSRLKIQGDGKPRLFILRDSVVRRDISLAEAKKPTCTAEEIPGYVWQGTERLGSGKEAPVKEDDHGCDALRYMVAQLDLGSRPSFRWAEV